MKIAFIFILLTLFSIAAFGRGPETLVIRSKVFGASREVTVHFPDSYGFRSSEVRFPVIYVLDGQHEWFVEPLLSDIEFLQYTHEIPKALVVTIPLVNRIKECGQDKHLLHKFVTDELEKELEKFGPGGHRTIVGHSFSASFALYSFLEDPKFYSAVIANSPLNELEEMIKGTAGESPERLRRINISVGGIAKDKDHYHRLSYNRVKAKYPKFFESVNVYEADDSAHNAVPIVADPFFLTRIFSGFRSRYSSIAPVDIDYKFVGQPADLRGELKKIIDGSKLDGEFYPPEIADINGMASRYAAGDLAEYELAVYRLGIKYYPNYYDFYLSAYDLLKESETKMRIAYLEKADLLLRDIDEPSAEDIETLRTVELALKKLRGTTD